MPLRIAEAIREQPGSQERDELNRYAEPTPRPISVNMLRLRLTTDLTPRTKNGQPAQSTTGVPEEIRSTAPCARRARRVRSRDRGRGPWSAPAAARSARRRSRTGAGNRPARGWGLRRLWGRPSAPGPCRISGNHPGRRERFPGASGRCIACLQAREALVSCARLSGSAQDRRQTCRGTSASRSARFFVVFEARLARAKRDGHAANRILHRRDAGRIVVRVQVVRWRVRMLGLMMLMFVPARPCTRVHGNPFQVVWLPASTCVLLTGQALFLQGTMPVDALRLAGVGRVVSSTSSGNPAQAFIFTPPHSAVSGNPEHSQRPVATRFRRGLPADRARCWRRRPSGIGIWQALAVRPV
jgi:hypothetical protein